MVKTSEFKRVYISECFEILDVMKKQVSKRIFTSRDISKIFPDLNKNRINAIIRKLERRNLVRSNGKEKIKNSNGSYIYIKKYEF